MSVDTASAEFRRRYETSQVERAHMYERRHFAVAAEAYGEDVVRMVTGTPEQVDYFMGVSLVRLYARIAAHFALEYMVRQPERFGEELERLRENVGGHA